MLQGKGGEAGEAGVSIATSRAARNLTTAALRWDMKFSHSFPHTALASPLSRTPQHWHHHHRHSH
jgi:hypothetical protein